MVGVIWLVGAAHIFFSVETNSGWITPLIP